MCAMKPPGTIIETDLGSLECNGYHWVFYFDYNSNELEMVVDDCDGMPDPAQMDFLRSMLPKIPEYEAICRKKVKAVDGHDLENIFFEGDCECQLAFNWGNGDWGRTVLVKMTDGKVIDIDILSD